MISTRFKFIALWLCLLGVPTAVLAEPVQSQAAEESCVVLLHGLFRSAWSMRELAEALEAEGYPVANITYPSLIRPIEELAPMAVESGLEECGALVDGGGVHFVTHSLGGILLRQYTATREIEQLRRVVMLGPPNHGSQFADNLLESRFIAALLPPAANQLGTGGDASIPAVLGPVDFELGVIAGTVNHWPFLPPSPSEQLSDGTVTVEEAKVEGMVDFITVPVGHSFLMNDEQVQRQVISFLQTGYFER